MSILTEDDIRSVEDRFPGVSIDASRLVAWLQERPDRGDQVPELALCWACLEGNAVAIEHLERLLQRSVVPALRGLKLTTEGVDEALQVLRTELLVGGASGVPKLSAYAGRGSLAGWLKITGVRRALKLSRVGQHEVLVDDDVLLDSAGAGEQPDPEIQYMKALYREAFRGAFAASLDRLSPREKNLLRQSAIDGLSIDELGGLYRVHRATAARWLTAARMKLTDGIKRALSADERLEKDECESILRLVQSQLDETIRRRLQDS